MKTNQSQPITEPHFFGLVRLFTPFSLFSLALLGLGFGLTSSSLSAATLEDLKFTLINNTGNTEYSVSAVDATTITGAVDIPATHNGLPVTQIAYGGFRKSAITLVSIPNSLTVIQDLAFDFCPSLVSVTIPEGSKLTTISQYAFYACGNLKNIVLPDSLTTIGRDAFGYCTKLVSINIPSEVTALPNALFTNSTALETVTFAEGSKLTSIGDQAFFNCRSLVSINLPDSLSTLGSRVFSSCLKLVSITIPSKVTVIPNELFRACTALETVTFAEGSKLTTIGLEAFYYCTSLETIDLPNSLTTLGNSAFTLCTSLVSITIPSGVTSLPDNLFRECSALASIALLGAAPTLGADVFTDTGTSVGGLTFTIYDTHEASYASWRTLYTFNVVVDPTDPTDPGDPSDPTDPVHLLVAISYNPSNHVLSLLSDNEPSDVVINLEHTNSLHDQWAALNSIDYTVAIDATTGITTRTLSFDPETSASGFYRLSSETSGNTE